MIDYPLENCAVKDWDGVYRQKRDLYLLPYIEDSDREYTVFHLENTDRIGGESDSN